MTHSPAAGAAQVVFTALTERVIVMMWLDRLKPQVVVAAVLILATAGVAVQGRQQPAAEGAREQAKTAPPPTAGAGASAVPGVAANRALAREQLALIDDALANLHELAMNARISIADPSFSLWGRRKLDTLRKTGASKAEIVAALEKYIADMKEEEVLAKARREASRGTQVELYDIRFRRLEAEIFLNDEKAR